MLLSLAGHWFACRIWSLGRSACISDTGESVASGMSGSPILVDGKAIGVVCLGADAPNPPSRLVTARTQAETASRPAL
jgi:hypothetical protein